jgi:hypothetical protein
MVSAPVRIAGLILAAIVLFVVTAFTSLQLIPVPRRGSDYLVAGSLATFAALSVLFTVLVTTWLRRRDIFYRRLGRRPVENISESVEP